MSLRGPVAATALALAIVPSAQAWAATAPDLRAPNLKPAETSDEGGLWEEMGKSEVKLKASAQVDQDPAINAYVRGVVCKIAAEYCNELRVYVLDAPILNAYVAPNGYVAVYSGLLLRVRTEDELAYVLGHEVSHFARNHSLARQRSLKNTANGTMLFSLAISAAAQGAMYSAASSGAPGSYDTVNSIGRMSQGLVDLTYLVGVARFFGFNREQESEADVLGFERAVKAGYAGAAAPAIWNDVVAEQKASEFRKVRDADARLGIFDTHPLTADRIAVLAGLASAAGGPDSAVEAARRYRANIRPQLAAWLKDDLRRRDWGQTFHLLSRLEGEGEDMGLLSFWRGEVYRLRRAEGDTLLAQNAYRAATAHDDAPAAAWRELGEASRKLGDKAAAREAFTTYIARSPEAQDRWLVEAGLKNL